MNERDSVMCQVREALSGLRMDVPLEDVFARSRAHQRRRLSGLTAAGAATAGAAVALTLALGGAGAPARSGGSPSASPGSVRLAAFSVTRGPSDSTTLILYKGPKYAPLDPSALRTALAQHGIPALVTVGTFCRDTTGSLGSFDQVLHPASLPDGSAEMVIDGAAMPPGTQLSIGYLSNAIRMAIIQDGAALSCTSPSDQPAAHTAVSGNAVRG